LSNDGGQTFSETLASNSPNDGNQLVTLPPTAQNQLRILVESVDNVYFNINSNDFSVEFAERRVFFARHTEKETGLDPSLTEAGKRRAKALAQLMANAGVTNVFSTDTRRSRETAEATAGAIGRAVQLYSDTTSLVDEINSLPLGSRVLVIGHSDTPGPLTTALGATDAIQIGEDEYDYLFSYGLREGMTTLENYKYSVPPPPSLFSGLNPAEAERQMPENLSEPKNSTRLPQDEDLEKRKTSIKLRLGRNETMAAELIAAALDATPRVREQLNTDLARELKKNLPQMVIGGTKYYFVESDRRINEDQLLIYASELNIQYAKWRTLQSQPLAVRRLAAASVDAGLVSEKESGKIVRWVPGSEITYCVMRHSFGNGSQANEHYNFVVNEIKNAASAWSSIPNATVPKFVHLRELDNSPPTQTPNGVTFAVWSIDLPGSVIASAFFPNDPQSNWNVLIDPGAYFGHGLSFDRVGVLRHELGHVLGFRHEHPRTEAPLVCQTLEVFDNQVIPLGEYDPVSVMHYFCRGFNDPDQEALNVQRRKLMLTPLDIQGTRLVYPPAGQSSGFEYYDFDPSRVAIPVELIHETSPISPQPPVGNGTSRTGKFGENLKARDTNAIRGEVNQATGVAGRSSSELWREPQDTESAINQSDLYAWKLFVALNWPANLEQRQADPNRVFGDHATTVWESWKLSSGRNDQVFLKDGLDPGEWLDATDANNLKAPFEKRILDFEALPLQQQQRQKTVHAEFDPDRSVNGLNENHMNKEAYEFIRERELYYVEGQEKLFDDAKKLFELARRQNRLVAAHEYKLQFPVGSKEVKAQWRLITSEDKPRYHWAEFTASDGSKLLFGLTALHITTKDVPNWFWATFEHTDNPSRAGAEPWQTPTVDSSAGPKGYPPGLGIEGTRWENYRLRGSQVEFTDSFGDPTILANSQIEQGFQLSSSCITCHARAAIGQRLVGQSSANRLSIFKSELPQAGGPSIVSGNVGSLPEELFIQRTFDNSLTGDLTYLQLDFVWSLMRAQRKISSGPVPSEVSFSQHIKPLFRQRDIDAMKRAFDLRKHADVSLHAEAIFSRLSDGSMPCDSPWPSVNIELFRKWIEGGKKE
jgi:hypothetical protein